MPVIDAVGDLVNAQRELHREGWSSTCHDQRPVDDDQMT